MSAVALVRFKTGSYTLLDQRGNRLVTSEQEKFPLYDMAKIPAQVNKFRIPAENYQKYLNVLNTKEGKLIVNQLKNHKTNAIIDEFLLINRSNVKVKEGSTTSKKYNILSWIDDLTSDNLGDVPNMLPQKVLSISKEDIYEAFCQRNLI